MGSQSDLQMQSLLPSPVKNSLNNFKIVWELDVPTNGGADAVDNNLPLFEACAEENQAFDDLNSEQVGKRKTIHSMSALSMNQRVKNSRDMMFIDDGNVLNVSTGAALKGTNSAGVSASEAQLKRNIGNKLIVRQNSKKKQISQGQIVQKSGAKS